MKATLLLALPLLVVLPSRAQTAGGVFVIEAEDFNYNSGQTQPQASVMPYLGGAYAGLTATLNIDFQRGADASSPAYRNDNRIPMNDNMGDASRGPWSVTTNFKLGWTGAGNWYNYTRNFPTNYYKVYAALSYGDTSPNTLQGSLQLVTSGATTTSQTLSQLGSFNGPGSGGWGLNNLVPLRDSNGNSVIVQLGGTQTIRFTAGSGDIDYYKFVIAGPPQIATHPASQSVMENRPVTFTVVPLGDDPVAYQWQSNLVNITGATSSNYTFAPRLAASGSKFRCVLTNPLGSTNSLEATLTVTNDLTPPHIVRALNQGATQIRLVFDEGVLPPGGPASASFSLNSGITVSAVSEGPASTDLLLSVSPLAFGNTYTVTVNNVTDLANTPNTIAPNTTVSFIASEYQPGDIGNPALPGSVARLTPGAFDVTGAGSDIGGTADEFQFAWEARAGDFDIATRIAAVDVTDPYLHVGLMARETLAANSRFAAAFASSSQLGAFFESRAAAGGTSSAVAPSGGFPANYPQMWLRLRRAAANLTGFASVDGRNWVQLGTTSISGLPAQAYFGLAVCSGDPARLTTARFRDVGAPPGTTLLTSFTPDREPPGPSSRRTGIVFSEIMYHPTDRPDLKNLEFVELHNAGSVYENLGGWRLSGAIDFTFPTGFTLGAGAFVVVAANPADFLSVHSLTNIVGPYTNNLPNDTGILRLRNERDAVRLEVSYSDEPPWPAATDGAGHSLVLTRPSYGENDPRAWAASDRIGGSPGDVDALHAHPWQGVVINEVLAHTDLPQVDFVELHNRSNSDVDLSGCVVTDDPTTNRFVFPNGTFLSARGFLALTENDLGFRLSAAGETVHLLSSNSTRVIDALRFGPQQNGVSSGRSPDGAATFRRLSTPTPGGSNAGWRPEEIVINEIMYNPISGDDADEYVELHNRSAAPVDLSGWKFTAGIDYEFPPGTTLASQGYLVVGRNSARLLASHPQLNTGNTRGDYSGSLANGGERLALTRPDLITSTNELSEVTTNLIRIVVSEVTYADGGRWGQWADGGGSSLELVDPDADLLRPSNWADSNESQKAPWTTISFTGTLDNGNTDPNYAPNRLHLLLLGPGECLVDNVEIFRSGSTNLLANPGFESGATGWSFFGNHSTSTLQATGADTGTQCLHIRAQGDGDTGINSIRAPLGIPLASGNTATLRARVRWLAGWPQILLRTRGNWIECAGDMTLPTNLGSPGLVNSRRVANAGPALYDVTHTPPLPRANQAVLVTCRVSDPDGFTAPRLRYRVDPSATLTDILMRDDGAGGDTLAGDGLYSATLPGRAAGNLVAFRIEATDIAAASAVFPPLAPAQECLVRWGDPAPFGSFAHYHMWNTAATESARGNALNNTLRDATLVYGAHRVVYNIGFRDKGSPWHGGAGDFVAITPADDQLLGATDRVFASTGNGGSEPTGMRSRMASWLARQLGVPALHAHYLRLYRNGNQHRDVSEDLEQPNHDFAESWFPDSTEGDLYKIAMWFEFQDDNSGFSANSATIQRALTTGGAYKLARYRWMFQRRSNDGDANNFTNLFNLVTAINTTSGGILAPAAANSLLSQADIDQWMRVYAMGWIMGDWDMWSFSVGQNMYLYKPDGRRWSLIRWDIDFTFGLGSGPNERLWSGQDPTINAVYDTPAFRRMLWQAYLDAANEILLPSEYGPPMTALRTILLKNGITGLGAPDPIADYIDQRRSFILSQLAANNTAPFAITSNSGNNFSVATPTVALTGTAPFAAASIEVNGIPYPVTWTSQTAFQITIPLLQGANTLVLTGVDRDGSPIPGSTDTITVTFTGTPQLVQDYISLNEVHYNALEPGGSFLEIHNRSTTTPFDLSGFRVEGLGYTFPEGAILQPNSFLLLVRDRAAFAAAYGPTIPVFDEFPGSLDNGGEYLALIKPGSTQAEDLVISDVRYDNTLPWPLSADGLGPSLQLVDPAQDEFRVGNWTAAPTNSVDRVTPGRANLGRQSLPAFPPVWINEVQSQNLSGPLDNAGEREPWVELYNSSSSSLDLSAFYLTDTYTNLTRWQFPAGTSLAPGQFLTLWTDGEPGESSTPLHLHTNFRLNPTNGSVALVRLQGSPTLPAVMDYVDYVQLAPDRTIGSYPDGEPRRRRLLYYATPGATNNPNFPPVQLTLNEFMAANNTTIADPADGDFDDWFEIHNRGVTPVDLTSYTLTDNLTNSTQFRIPSGYIVPPGGFLLVWADNETDQNQPTNSDLHASFQLSAAGEQLGLFSPDGSLVDSLAFGAQTADVSVGRFPDSGDLPLLIMGAPTPGAPNVLSGANQPPVISAVGSKSVTETTLLSFTLVATDPDAGQTLTYSLATGAPSGTGIDSVSGQFTWIPTESQGPASYPVTVIVRDNGSPLRTASQTFTISVLESNRPPVLVQPANAMLPEGSAWSFALAASDPDLPTNNLSFLLGAGAPAGLNLDPSTGILDWTPTENQGPGSYPVTVTVNDNASPPFTDSRSFTLTVIEVNNPPTFAFIQPQTTDELAPWSFAAQAVDPDNPPSSILYALEGSPLGAQINPNTGLITWTPPEAQGPTNAIFSVRATEQNADALSSTRSFSVAVNEVNQPPVLPQPPDITLTEGQTLDLALSATDADLPAQTLTYAIVSGAPAGANLDPDTGRFLWITTPDQGASTNIVTVRVTDNGPGTLASTKSFTLVVRPAFHAVLNEIMYRPAVPNTEFIEFHNTSFFTTEDLSGLRLSASGLSYTFAAGTLLPPGAFLCVARDPASFRNAYGIGLPVVGPWTGNLTPADTIDLIRPGSGGQPDALLDSVTYSSLAPWPTNANGSGASLQLADPLRDNNRVGNWLATSPFPGSSQLITLTNLWRYWQSGPADPAWRDVAFDDAGWTLGNALLFVESATLPASKNTQLILGQTTYYFRASFNVPALPTAAGLQLTHVLDDGMIVWLNGTELFRTNMPSGAANHDTFAAVIVGDATLSSPVTLPATALRAGENVVAVEVHQANAGSSDVVLGLSLDLTGGTVVPYTPGTPNNVITSLPEFPDLRINEVLTRNATGLADTAGDREPWIEVVNPGPTAVSLDGLWLSANTTNLAQWPFPTGYAVPPGGFVLLFADGEPAEQSPTEWHTSFRLPTTPGQNWTVVLSRSLNSRPQPIDAFWGTVGPDDVSIGRLPDGDPSSSESITTPTPGASNLTGPVVEIISVSISAQGQPTFVWTAQSGQSYRIEYKNDLNAPSWINAGSVIATADTASFVDTAAIGVARRFYRVVLQ